MFFGLFETQNGKVSILFYVHEGPKIKKKMLIFLFWVSRLPKKNAENIFLPYINLWTTMKFGFQDQIKKKRRKNLQGVLFSQCRSKTPVLAKIYIF